MLMNSVMVAINIYLTVNSIVSLIVNLIQPYILVFRQLNAPKGHLSCQCVPALQN